jgi:hypothetical protein
MRSLQNNKRTLINEQNEEPVYMKFLLFLSSLLLTIRAILPWVKPTDRYASNRIRIKKAKPKYRRIDEADILEMKKPHICGCKKVVVMQTSQEQLKLKCLGCGREFLDSRTKHEKKSKIII